MDSADGRLDAEEYPPWSLDEVTDFLAWSLDGCGKRQRRPRRGTATAITPPATLAVLRAGYPVQIAAP